MFGSIEGFTGAGGEGGEANASGGIAEGVLELRQLFHESGFAGAGGGCVQREGVVQYADDDLYPVHFAATKLFHFEAQGALLGVVGLLHEVGESFCFAGDAITDFLGGGDGFTGVGLHGLPEAGGEVDLGGDVLEILHLRDGGGQAFGFGELDVDAVFQDEREHGEQSPQRNTGADGSDGEVGERIFALEIDEAGDAQHEGIANEEGPFRDRGPSLFAHGGHGVEEAVRECKSGRCWRALAGQQREARCLECVEAAVVPGFILTNRGVMIIGEGQVSRGRNQTRLKMQIFTSSVRDQRVAFTLTEVLVAVGVVGVLFVSLYLAFSAGFSMIRVTRENLAATQIMTQRAETIRLYTWTQLLDPTFFKTNFTEDATASLGTTYHGNIVLSVPTYLGFPPPSYLNDLRTVTISVRWTNSFGKPMPHYREMQTQVAKHGLGNYAFGN